MNELSEETANADSDRERKSFEHKKKRSKGRLERRDVVYPHEIDTFSVKVFPLCFITLNLVFGLTIWKSGGNDAAN